MHRKPIRDTSPKPLERPRHWNPKDRMALRDADRRITGDIHEPDEHTGCAGLFAIAFIWLVILTPVLLAAMSLADKLHLADYFMP